MDVHQYVKVAYVRVTPVKICTQGENVYRRLTTELDMEFTRFLKGKSLRVVLVPAGSSYLSQLLYNLQCRKNAGYYIYFD